MGRKKAAVRDDDESGHAGGKSKKKAFSIGDDEYYAATEISKKLGLKDEEEDAPAIEFAGKKKGKKSAWGVNSAFELLREEEEELAAFESLGEDEESRDKEEENVGINFTGKKKKKSKGLNKASGNLGVLDEENDEGNNIGETTFEAVNGDFDIIEPNQRVDETKTKKQTNEGVLEKKKSGKSPQEGDDFDKILGAVPTSVETLVVPPPEKKADVDEEKEDEGPVESAALKKKKKKKEKEKAKKAAAAEDKQKEANTEVINKPAEKTVPSHVRAKQEELARRKEAEEKIKREEDERLRKEEEERLRIEEEERIAEEKRRLKKEKEKEKLLKKKQEGKLLTKKQKKEACRSEAMRRQILSKASMQTDTGEISGVAAKRPLYQKKNSKPQAPSDGTVDNTTLDSGQGRESKETPQEDAASSSTKDKTDASVFQENTVDDDEWDAKSWDDADLKLPGKGAFDDEEVDLWPEPLLKKETPSVAAKGDDLAEKVARSKNVDFKKKNSEADASDKNNNKIPIHRGKTKNKEQKSDDHPVQNGQNLRSPICCIMGHVDTGKTKLLDCIRGTNVQEGEAGGITQQIGATYFPAENIRERTRELKDDARLNVPGLLVIDTPGHESFTNLRSRGSGLCDIAVLVVDIMHGLEQQTIESLNLLKMRNTYFIVALNKVDTLYGWKKCPNAPIRKAMAQQTRDVQDLFNDGIKKVKNQLQEQGLNTELYYKNKEMEDTFHIVPTSAKSGEGIPDLLLLLVIWAQKTMIERLTYTDVVQCTVLEVKVVEGHGTTVDVVLVNGVLHEGDQIVVCGMQGPIVTTIRTLLTPHPMKELRVKGTYLHHKEIKAAMGIKITAQGLDHTIAGTSLYVVGPHDDLEDIKVLAMEDMKSVMSKIDISSEGVYVQASTLGSLEALLEFLKSPAVHIPVSGISIGPVHKKDVMKASVMLEKKKEYGTILAFDVKVTEEARELADNLGVKIFTADVIYHLFDLFKAYIDNLKEEKKKKAAKEAVFPCVLKIKPDCVIHAKDPLVLGVDVLEGIVKVGTPICVPQREFIDIGLIDSIQFNKKNLDYAKKGQMVAIKIINQSPGEQHKIFGRHFDVDDQLVSKISRSSIDALAENYAEDLSPEMVRLLKKLKVIFHIR